MKCATCKKTFATFSALITHMRKECEKINISVTYKCGEDQCYRYFTDVKSFRRHFQLKHSENVPPNELPDISNGDCFVTEEEALISDRETEIMDTDNESVEHADSIIRKEVIHFISSLYTNASVSRSAVQVVVSNLQTLMANIAQPLMSAFGPEVNDDESISGKEIKDRLLKLNTALKGILSPFGSEFLRLRVFSSMGSFIPPDEVTVGYDTDTSQHRNTLSLQTKNLFLVQLLANYASNSASAGFCNFFFPLRDIG